MLDRRRVEVGADPCEQRLALAPIVAEDADLDQFVRQQVDVDLMQHGRSKSVLSDADEWMQMVRLRAKRPPLRGC